MTDEILAALDLAATGGDELAARAAAEIRRLREKLEETVIASVMHTFGASREDAVAMLEGELEYAH